MSFFDDVEEPSPEPRRRRPQGTGSRPPRTGRPSRPDQQAVQRRRLFAVIGVVVAIVVIALLVHGCQVSANNDALKDYNNNVSTLLGQSQNSSTALFKDLTNASLLSNPPALRAQISQTLGQAQATLESAQKLSVPSAMQDAQQKLVFALQMRRDGIADIAAQIEPALGKSASQDAIDRIAADMARFYASDVVYIDYAAQMIASALNAANVTGQQIFSGQFLPNIQWVLPTYVASQLHASPGSSATAPSNVPVAPGVHGDRMISVSVGGTQLQQGASNTVARTPPPTFVCTFQNDGQNTETDTVVKVVVEGTSITGQAVVAQTQPGQQYNASVTLSASPPAGTYTVTATVERVPGETSIVHNTQTFQVTFQ